MDWGVLATLIGLLDEARRMSVQITTQPQSHCAGSQAMDGDVMCT